MEKCEEKPEGPLRFRGEGRHRFKPFRYNEFQKLSLLPNFIYAYTNFKVLNIYPNGLLIAAHGCLLLKVQALGTVCSFGRRADCCPASWGLGFNWSQQSMVVVFCICKVLFIYILAELPEF
jgi:hypothetical protein